MTRTAIVGATGAVGRTMLSILEQREFPVSELRLFASARSAGGKVETAWGTVEIEDLATADPAGVEIALFSAGGDRSKQYAPAFAAAGAVVVDNSSAFRMETDVPLVVAGVNDHAVANRPRGIIANPNCTTMDLMMAAGPLHRAAGLRTMVATSYQSVSGSGMKGIDELIRQTDFLRPDSRGAAGGRVAGSWFRGLCPPDRVQRDPLRRSRERAGLHRRGVEAGQRDPQDPRGPRGSRRTHLRAGAGDGGTRYRRHHVLRPGTRAFRGGRTARGQRPACRCGRTSRPPRSTRPASTTSWWAASARPSASRAESTSGWWATTSAKAPPSTPCRSPSSSWSDVRPSDVHP